VELPLIFGPHLDYRKTDDEVDIRSIWEPNRHLQLTTVAQAYALTRAARYLRLIRALVDSWLEQCPYLHGPNWTSTLEAGIRLINWSLTWQLIGGKGSQIFDGADGVSFRNRWLTSIYQHMHFIRHGFSRYSSANNHLIGEAAGLFVASRTWPFLWKSEPWGNLSKEILQQEALQQNAADGGNREQAFAYQQFVLNFLLLAGLAARNSGSDFNTAYWDRVMAMMEFIASLMDAGGNIPMVGDADDGLVIRLSPAPHWCPFRSLLATGAVLFQRSDFRAKAGRLDEQTVWLLGDEASGIFNELREDDAGLPVRRAHEQSGYYILGDRFETPDEIRAVVDAGPLGYLSIAAHGHADALSILLSVGGKEILIDPGTYVYNTKRRWRDYFRGTAAHNTIRVDYMDQAQIGGSFLWLGKADGWCERWVSTPEFDELVASHDGYRRLPDPVVHRRTFRFNKSSGQIDITDEIECQGEHTIEICWHFSERCHAFQSERRLCVTRDDIRVTLQMTQGQAELQLFYGDEERPAGWVSRRFGVKTAAPEAVWFAKVNGSARFITRLSIEREPSFTQCGKINEHRKRERQHYVDLN
jgi:hypothetical protein